MIFDFLFLKKKSHKWGGNKLAAPSPSVGKPCMGVAQQKSQQKSVIIMWSIGTAKLLKDLRPCPLVIPQ